MPTSRLSLSKYRLHDSKNRDRLSTSDLNRQAYSISTFEQSEGKKQTYGVARSISVNGQS